MDTPTLVQSDVFSHTNDQALSKPKRGPGTIDNIGSRMDWKWKNIRVALRKL